MTDNYTFLSWVRDGVAAVLVQDEDLSAGLSAQASLDIQLDQLSLTTQRLDTLDVTLAVHGPGDVLSLDPAEIVRVDPPPGSMDVEPHYLPLVEFRRPDLPWLFTPAAGSAATGQKLRPWLALVVVPEEKARLVSGVGDGGRVSRLVCPVRELPEPAETWAWAHAQVVGLAPGESVGDVLANDPDRARSRLLAPRRLLPGRRYLACLVPAFRAGVEAASGQEVITTTLEPGWPSPAGAGDDDQVELPVFHHWRFGTGETGGDLESLVRRLTPRALGDAAVRRLDVGDPGAGLTPDGPGDQLPLGGALVPSGYRDEPWAAGEWFTGGLRARLDAAADAAEPVVAPPLYAGRHAGVDRPPADGTPPHWVRELNLDPRLRVYAGLGVRTVERFQDVLMASAWEQYDQVREINQTLRQAQLAREVSAGVYRRRIATLRPATQLQVTDRAYRSPETRLPPALDAVVTSPARRIARPGGPVVRRSARAVTVARVPNVILNGVALIMQIARRPVRGDTSAAPPSGEVVSVDTVVLGTRHMTAAALRARQARFETVMERYSYHQWTISQDVADESGIPIHGGGPPFDPPTGHRLTTAALARAAFTAAIAFADRQAVLRDLPATAAAGVMAAEPEAVDVGAVAGRRVGLLSPETTVPEFVDEQLGDLGGARPAGTLEPVMAAPSFPWPMVEALRETAPDFLFPPAALLPDTVGILQSHPGFVEAYLMGLNHGMADELLWRGYPTDRRGTYFRQFWDRAGLGTDDDPADLEPLHQLSPQHRLLARPAAEARLALVIRGELLRRFPDLLLTVTAATFDGQARVPDPGGPVKEPVLEGRLGEDAAYYLFDLPVAQARGGGDDPGWFVVFREPPTGVRFGLDPADADPAVPASLDDLAWPHVLGADVARYVTVVDLPSSTSFTETADSADPGAAPVTWAANGAHMARCFARGPASVAWHVDALLPTATDQPTDQRTEQETAAR